MKKEIKMTEIVIFSWALAFAIIAYVWTKRKPKQ